MRAKSGAKDDDRSRAPDWIVTDTGIRRSDLPRDLRWLADPLAVHGPAASARGWGWAPIWRRE